MAETLFLNWRRLGTGWLIAMAVYSLHAAPVPNEPVAIHDPSAQVTQVYDDMRLRWRDMLTGGTNLNITEPNTAKALAALSSSAQSFWDSMDKSPDRTFLWSDLANLTNNSGEIWSTYTRLRTMAMAYATAGTKVQGNAAFLADLVGALDWMQAHIYNVDTRSYGNWWHWDIGIPLKLNDITVLLYDSLTKTQIENYMNAVNKFSPRPIGTAANLVWAATIVAVRGVIVKDGAKIAAAAGSMTSIFPYVTSGDGFYPDGSFIQHSTFPYTGSYGSSLLMNLAPLLQLLQGSPWQVNDPNLKNVYQWIHGAYEPLIYQGAMMDMVRGRVISRGAETDQIVGHWTIAAILRLAEFAPLVDATACKSMVKQWIETDTARSFFADADVGVFPLAQALLADTNLPASGEFTGHYHFGAMDRVVHRRLDYSFGISMFSSRIANYESINSENLHGWHTADGMTYLYNADESQFSDGFWPTVNPYRLPGTTVDTQTLADGSGAGYRSPCNWVGGVTLNACGAAGMQLVAWHSTLTAKKSWFMFNDEIVCLGTGITSFDNRVVETVVENRKLNGDGSNTFTVNGVPKSATLGWSEAMTNVSWAQLSGNVRSADIGYYFPRSASLNGLRERRSGSWQEINNAEFLSTNKLARNYLTLWFDHGTKPLNGSYAYVLLPGKSASEVRRYAANPGIEILENCPQIQAVKQNQMGLTAANFWNDGVQTLAGITVNHKAAVLLQMSATNLVIAVSDPTQTNTVGITVTINQPVGRAISLDSGVVVKQLTPTLELTVNSANGLGKSFHASFALDP